MASPADFARLPAELLVAILAQVGPAEPSGGNGLLPCLGVCRAWKRRVAPLLYEDVVLRADGLRRFLDAFDREAAVAATRSLTICGPFDLHAAGPLDGLLPRLAADVLPQLRPRLRSFSLWAERTPVARAAVAAVLAALPPGCVHLELELALDAPLCADLRALLPRLRSLRLNLNTLCAGLLGTRGPAGDLRLAPLPATLALTVQALATRDCAGADGASAAVSGWRAVTAGLERAVAQGVLRADVAVATRPRGSIPAHAPRPRGRGRPVHNPYTTYLLCEATSAGLGTWAFLQAPIEQYGWYTRTDRGGFVTDHLFSRWDLVEGCRWRLSARGARLPAGMSEGRVLPAAPTAAGFGVWPEAQWRRHHPDAQCRLWADEARAGTTLFEPEKLPGSQIRLLDVRKILGLISVINTH